MDVSRNVHSTIYPKILKPKCIYVTYRITVTIIKISKRSNKKRLISILVYTDSFNIGS